MEAKDLNGHQNTGLNHQKFRKQTLFHSNSFHNHPDLVLSYDVGVTLHNFFLYHAALSRFKPFDAHVAWRGEWRKEMIIQRKIGARNHRIFTIFK